MKKDKDTTVVVFRKWKDGGYVIAFFPLEAETKGLCSSYEHVGQHGCADYKLCLGRTLPATQKEYAGLKRELEGLGYNLVVPHDIRAEIQTGVRPQGSELIVADLGRPLSISEGFGKVLPGDVGKRVWHRTYGFVIENNEQRDQRKGKKS
jgi:hypothetical protein